MKKIALSLVSVVLLLTLVCGSAFAATGDLTIKAVKAYSDPEMTQYIGTIPKYTSVLVRAYGSYAHLKYNGSSCYISPSALTQGKYDYKYMGKATLAKGATIYQRPSTSARSVTNRKNCKVYVYGTKKGMAMIRSGKGVYGFVSTSSLTDMNSGL
jgi:hypothetical protein